MKKRYFNLGVIFLLLFLVWTWLIINVDVQPVGQNNSIGFYFVNY